MPTPSLSVIIPTYRRPALLARCLSSLAAQGTPKAEFEIVVADDGSHDHTARTLAAASEVLPNLRWTELSANAGPAAARNRAVELSRGDLLLFLDDDVVASPNLVTTHLQLHDQASDRRLGLLGLVQWEPGLRVTPFMRWLDGSGLQFAYETWLAEGPVDPPFGAFYTANLSLHREMFTKAGGFDERFPYASFEDLELCWRLTRLGFRLEYRPQALAYHARAIDLRVFKRRTMKDAESARLLRMIQPEFPLDESDRKAGLVGPRRRMVLRMLAPLATLAQNRKMLEAHYRAEIAHAYLAGSLRAGAGSNDVTMQPETA